jgi:endonuclease YncB( thermonuclease family)
MAYHSFLDFAAACRPCRRFAVVVAVALIWAWDTSVASDAAACREKVIGTGRVVEVTEAAELVLADGRRLRMAGAEPVESHAFREALAALVLNEEVSFSEAGIRRDRWQRIVAHVWLTDGRWVERVLIAAGLAIRSPGLPDETCASLLDATEADPWPVPDVTSARLGHTVRAAGRVSRLRKSGGRVYMKLRARGMRPLTVTMRDADFARLSAGSDEDWTGDLLRVRGHLEWWGEPTIVVAAPWDVKRATARADEPTTR